MARRTDPVFRQSWYPHLRDLDARILFTLRAGLEAPRVPGLIECGPGQLADTLGPTPSGRPRSERSMRLALERLAALGAAGADPGLRVLWHVLFPEDAPANPNMIRGWYAEWLDFPDCPTKASYPARLRTLLPPGESFAQAWAETFGQHAAAEEGVPRPQPSPSPEPVASPRPARPAPRAPRASAPTVSPQTALPLGGPSPEPSPNPNPNPGGTVPPTVPATLPPTPSETVARTVPSASPASESLSPVNSLQGEGEIPDARASRETEPPGNGSPNRCPEERAERFPLPLARTPEAKLGQSVCAILKRTSGGRFLADGGLLGNTYLGRVVLGAELGAEVFPVVGEYLRRVGPRTLFEWDPKVRETGRVNVWFLLGAEESKGVYKGQRLLELVETAVAWHAARQVKARETKAREAPAPGLVRAMEGPPVAGQADPRVASLKAWAARSPETRTG